MDDGESEPLMPRTEVTEFVDKTPRTICGFPLHWIESYEYTTFDTKNGFGSTIVLMINSMIGSGILVQAYVFMESGIISTIFVYLIVGFLAYLGCSILARTAENQSIFSYSMLVEKAYGRVGMIWYDFSVTLGNFGSLLSYFLIIGTLTVDIVEIATSTSSASAENWIKVAVTIGSFIAMVPLCLIRNFGHLYFVSYISIATIVGTVLLVMITSIFSVGIGSVDDSTGVNLGSAVGTFKTLGSVVFAFGFAQNVLFVHSSSQDVLRTVETFDNAIKVSVCVGVVLCFLIGLFGYLAFRDATDADILENYSSGVLGVLVKIPFIVHLILFIPGDFLVFRYSVLKLMNLNISTVSDTLYYTVTIVSLILIVSLSLILQIYCSTSTALSLVLDVTGGLAGSAIGFIFPALVAIRLLPYSWISHWQISCLVVAGCIVPVLAIASLFYDYT